MLENKNIIYTAEDIQKYLSGKMPPIEMNAMEKAALDDPFLAEALEGYDAMKNKHWEHTLITLREEFNTDKGAKVIALPKKNNNWWKAAAAVLLLAGSGAIIYNLTENNSAGENNNNNSIAQNIQPNKPTEQSVKNDTPATTVVSTQKNVPVTKQPQKSFIFANTDETIANGRTDSNFIYTPANKYTARDNTVTNKILENAVVKAEEKSVTENPSYRNNSNAAPVTVQNTNSINPGTVATDDRGLKQKREADNVFQTRKEQQLNRSFIAQVVGPDNTPLPFANVNIKSESFGTYADVKGNFRLVSSDSVLNVEIKSVGYEPVNYTLRSNTPFNKIVLAEQNNMALNDFAKDKKSTSNSIRRPRLLKDTIINVEPADGWDNYNTYVNNNLEIPEEVTNKNLHGEVEVSFEVEKNGAISNIKVDKSLCNDCDEAAKRLIEQGPQWKVKSGKKGKAKVKVKF